MTDALLVLAALASTLVAGLFAGFAYAVMPGLRRVDDVSFVQTMRGVNGAILNPVFGTLFGGALVLCVAATVAAWDLDAIRWWVLSGTLLYVLTLVVTIGLNVPLNDALRDGVDPDGILRTAFEPAWRRWNLVRTGTNLGSAVCLLIAVLHA